MRPIHGFSINSSTAKVVAGLSKGVDGMVWHDSITRLLWKMSLHQKICGSWFSSFTNMFFLSQKNISSAM
ncbi:MAG: hypothetical protein MK226_17685 [Saprospiraceae bacterium]|jgi:hypothetical protein|nr:hypothetical protein [Saprospiraceae bacterium]